MPAVQPLLMILLFVVSLSVAEGSRCDVNVPLPKGNPHPIESELVTGSWYETVTSRDAISMDHTCVRVTNSHTTDAGHGATLNYFFDNGTNVTFHTHIKLTEDGYYKQEIVEKSQARALGRDANGHFDPKAVEEGKELMWANYAYLGDSTHYLAAVRCLPSGWAVWAFTREKSVSTERLVSIINDLREHGVTTTLRLGRCNEIPNI